MKIKRGDTVEITTGKSRGARGKVVRAIPKKGRVVVEGANLARRHRRPRKEGEKGQIIEVPMPLHASNVKKVDEKKAS